MVYHLNKQWKYFCVGTGVIGCLIGLGIFVTMLAFGQIMENLGAFLFLEFLFGGLGAELVYEGLNTKIELFEDKLIYYQSRYTFSAQWSDLYKVVPTPGYLLLGFSKTTKVNGGVIYDMLRVMKIHSTLAINMYLTAENRAVLRQKIAIGLKLDDEEDLQWLSEVI